MAPDFLSVDKKKRGDWEQWEVLRLGKSNNINKNLKKRDLGVEFLEFLRDNGRDMFCVLVEVDDKHSLRFLTNYAFDFSKCSKNCT